MELNISFQNSIQLAEHLHVLEALNAGLGKAVGQCLVVRSL